MTISDSTAKNRRSRRSLSESLDRFDRAHLNLLHARAIVDLVRALHLGDKGNDSPTQDCWTDSVTDALHCAMEKIKSAEDLHSESHDIVMEELRLIAGNVDEVTA